MSVFSSCTCGGLGDEGIGESLCPMKHFLLLLGRAALAPRSFLCLLWLWAVVSQGSWFVMALSQEMQVRGKVISHGQAAKKL